MKKQRLVPVSIKEKKLIRNKAQILLNVQDYLITYFETRLGKTISRSSSQQTILLIIFTVLVDSYKDFQFSFKIDQISEKNYESGENSYELWNYILLTFSTPLSSKKINVQSVNKVEDLFGNYPLPNSVVINIYNQLYDFFCADFDIELFPYILEVFEYEFNDVSENDKKKKNGIYYTPHDVANFIVDKTLNKLIKKANNVDSLKKITVLDPSCGTGIFLKISLISLIKKYTKLIDNFEQQVQLENDKNPLILALKHNIYGVDKSISAINSSIFTLLTCSLDILFKSKVSPYSLWKLLSLNIKQGDSTINLINEIPQNSIEKIMQLELKNRLIIKDFIVNNKETTLITEKHGLIYKNMNLSFKPFNYQLEFPEVFHKEENGFNCILGNPPYFKVSSLDLLNLQEKNYLSAGKNRDNNIYTLFVENMILYSSKKNFASGLVIPLSISYSQGKTSEALRNLITKDEASWEMFFFDRSPDSLFGDDIKTRNCIIFRYKSIKKEKEILTSSLIRWNSRNRNNLFKNLKTQSINDFSIKDFVPKISNTIEFDSLTKLNKFKASINDYCTSVPSSKITDVAPYQMVYFYSTAYNWIPTFLEIPKSYDKNGNSIIPSSLWVVKCTNPEIAKFIFAYCSSKLAYWQWAISGDGFHFPKKTLKLFKVDDGILDSNVYSRIVYLGSLLWEELKNYPVQKTNSGKIIGNYNPLGCQSIIDEIDKNLIAAFGLQNTFYDYLKEWYYNHIRAGRENFKNAEYINMEEFR